MSPIGPRPMILAEHDQIQARDRYGTNDIQPGLTGWAQINGRDGLTVEQKALEKGIGMITSDALLLPNVAAANGYSNSTSTWLCS